MRVSLIGFVAFGAIARQRHLAVKLIRGPGYRGCVNSQANRRPEAGGHERAGFIRVRLTAAHGSPLTSCGVGLHTFGPVPAQGTSPAPGVCPSPAM